MPNVFNHRANLIRCKNLAAVPIAAPPKDQELRSLRVVLAANRAVVQSVRLGEQIATPKAALQREFIFELPEPVAPGQEVPQLEIEWHNEPPVVIQSQWNPSSEPDPEAEAEAKELAAELTPQEIYTRRQERISKTANDERMSQTDLGNEPRAPLMQFFHDLDKETLPALLGKRQRRQMQALTYSLRVRLKQRGRARIEGRRFVAESLSPRLSDFATAISKQLCELFEDRFGDLVDDGILAEFDRSFERFVCGELAVALPDEPNPLQSHGAPNGINYLLFAEFALMALALESASERHPTWRRALPTFVRTSEMFLELYWNGGCRTFASYGFAWLDRGFSAAKCQRLREGYREVVQAGSEALAERFGLLCSHALRDDIGREVHQ